jgi:soluble lytic murein transglycosylase-like protein
MKKRVPQIFAAAILLFCSVAASAQTKNAKRAVTPAQAKHAAQQTTPSDDLQQFRQNFVKAAEDYRASLQQLLTPYQNDLQKAKDQQEKLKSLYTDGLISRVEFEATGTAITDAQAKLDGLQKQIAQADESIAAAKKPVEIPTFGDATVAHADIAWSTGNVKVDGLIRLYAKRYNVDPYLVFCVMHQESGFGAGATSPVGAMGLMQLMPGTAARYGVTNPYDPAQSIMGGTHYLSDLLRMFGGRVDLALAGYNAGEGAVMKYGNRIPPYAETQNYVRTIGTRYAQSGVSLTAKTSARPEKSK